MLTWFFSLKIEMPANRADAGRDVAFRCIQCLDELVWWLGLHSSSAGDRVASGCSSKLWAKSSVWAVPHRIRQNSWACPSHRAEHTNSSETETPAGDILITPMDIARFHKCTSSWASCLNMHLVILPHTLALKDGWSQAVLRGNSG